MNHINHLGNDNELDVHVYVVLIFKTSFSAIYTIQYIYFFEYDKIGA